MGSRLTINQTDGQNLEKITNLRDAIRSQGGPLGQQELSQAIAAGTANLQDELLLLSREHHERSEISLAILSRRFHSMPESESVEAIARAQSLLSEIEFNSRDALQQILCNRDFFMFIADDLLSLEVLTLEQLQPMDRLEKTMRLLKLFVCAFNDMKPQPSISTVHRVARTLDKLLSLYLANTQEQLWIQYYDIIYAFAMLRAYCAQRDIAAELFEPSVLNKIIRLCKRAKTSPRMATDVPYRDVITLRQSEVERFLESGRRRNETALRAFQRFYLANFDEGYKRDLYTHRQRTLCLSCRYCGKKEADHRCGEIEPRQGPKLNLCRRCLLVRYCSKQCQKRDWKNHKKTCSCVSCDGFRKCSCKR